MTSFDLQHQNSTVVSPVALAGAGAGAGGGTTGANNGIGGIGGTSSIPIFGSTSTSISTLTSSSQEQKSGSSTPTETEGISSEEDYSVPISALEECDSISSPLVQTRSLRPP